MIIGPNIIDGLRCLSLEKLLEIKEKVLRECPIGTTEKLEFTEMIDGLIAEFK
jgi:hypothetical protein